MLVGLLGALGHRVVDLVLDLLGARLRAAVAAATSQLGVAGGPLGAAVGQLGDDGSVSLQSSELVSWLLFAVAGPCPLRGCRWCTHFLEGRDPEERGEGGGLSSLTGQEGRGITYAAGPGCVELMSGSGSMCSECTLLELAIVLTEWVWY